MQGVVHALRGTALSRRLSFDETDLFDLLSAACIMCCRRIDGGNRTCPPQEEVEVIQES